MTVQPTTLETERELLRGVFYAFLTNPTPNSREQLEIGIQRYHKHMDNRDEARRDGHLTYRQMIGRAKRTLHNPHTRLTRTGPGGKTNAH